jgi:nucleoside-diphosphate-sugar epimerase
VVARHVPAYAAEFARRGWKMLSGIDRVYVNAAARRDLGWTPRFGFAAAIAQLARGEDYRSELTREVGSKGYHRGTP